MTAPHDFRTITATHPAFRDATPEARKGFRGEEILCAILRWEGYFVNMKSMYSALPNGTEGAPRFLGPARPLIMPDFDVARDGRRRWAEVKTYEKPAYHHVTRTYRHGLARRDWHAYDRVERETGCQVWIFILEMSTGGVFRLPLDQWRARAEALEAGTYQGDKLFPGGEYIVLRSDLELYGYFQDRQLVLALNWGAMPGVRWWV
jgi:hypothetical protein